MVSSISTVLMTGFIALASSSSVNAESMTTPLNYGVYSSATCTGETIDQGTTKYLAPLPAEGSFCESSITSVDSGDGTNTMVMAEIYTKINVVTCAAFPLSGEVSVAVFLCYDKDCGACKDSEEGAEAISASLILPDYGTSYPKQDACWGISSTFSTSYQKFAGDTMDLAAGRMDEGDDTAITAYWRIFADNSCIGPSVGAEKMAVEETAVAEPTVEEIIETETETGTAKAAESGSASLVATTTTVAVATMMMMLVLVGSL